MNARITDLGSKRVVDCVVAGIDGHTVHVTCAEEFPLRACVKVESGNQMWMGEVCACERRDAEFSIEMEATVMSNDVEMLNRTASRFRQSRVPAGEMPKRTA